MPGKIISFHSWCWKIQMLALGPTSLEITLQVDGFHPNKIFPFHLDLGLAWTLREE